MLLQTERRGPRSPTRQPLADPAAWRRRSASPRSRSTRLALKVLFVCLVLYVAFGKGFAYVGLRPVFVGEVLLVIVVASVVRGSLRVPRTTAAALVGGVAALAAVQFAVDRLVSAEPLLETLRGLAPIYYATFAFVLYALLRQAEQRNGTAATVEVVEGAMRRAVPFVIVTVCGLALLLLVEPTGILVWPGSDTPVLVAKATDIAVVLAILAPLLTRRHAIRWTPGAWAVLHTLWFVTAMLVVFRSRGALLALAAGMFLMRPRPTRVVKVAAAAVAVVAALYLSGFSLNVGGRELSAEAAVDSVVSVFGSPSRDQVGWNYVGTREWRSDWWAAIWADVTAERMLLHGRGWGDNLSIEYGVLPATLESDPRVLRLPHSIFFSLAGRGGVLVAIAFLLVPTLTVARSFRERPAVFGVDSTLAEVGRAGVVAAVVAALTDVYLESPQGGIVFWCLVGLLWWVDAARREDPLEARGREPNRATVWAERRPATVADR